MDSMLDYLSNPLLGPIVICLLAGALAWICSRATSIPGKLLALGASVWSVLVTARGFGLAPPQINIPWLDLTAWAGFDLPLALKFTWLGGIVATGAAIFALLIVGYSFAMIRKTEWEGKFYAYVIWALAGAMAVGYANHALVLLIAWEWTTLMLYLLLNLGRDPTQKGAAKTFAVLGLTDAGLLFGIALLLATTSTTGGASSLQLDKLSVTLSGGTDYLIFLLFAAAALAKAGAIPFHTWIPSAAEHGTTPVIAYLPAAVDKLLGIYLLARVCLQWFHPDLAMNTLLMFIGAVTILAAVSMAMIQHDLKKLLAFHAVSQVGYMVLGIATGNPIGIIGGLFHMINHAMYKCNLFLCAGTVEKQTGTTNLDELGGLARTLPVSFICCMISAAAISGVPPLNGFASKWLVYQGALDLGGWRAAIFVTAAVFGSALTLASFIKVMHSVYWGAPCRFAERPTTGREPLAAALPMVILAGLCVLFGIWLVGPVHELLAPAVADLGVKMDVLADGTMLDLGAGTIWSAGTATVLLLVGLAIGLIGYLIVRAFRVRIVRNYVGGEVVPTLGMTSSRPAAPVAPEDVRMSGTAFYQTMYQLGGIGPLLRDGQRGAFDIYRLGGQYGGRLVELLRSAHTGVLGLYVTWVIFGVAVMALYFVLR